jgi:hypothetical protein
MTLSAAGDLSLSNTTASTSSGTGALTVAGGVGVGEKLYVNGTAALSATVQDWRIFAGVTVQLNAGPDAFPNFGTSTAHPFNLMTSGVRRLIIGTSGEVNIPSTTASNGPSVGALTVAGGVGVGGALFGGYLLSNSYVCAGNGGGIGFYYFGNTANAKYMNYDGTGYNLVGGSLAVASATASTSPTTGALTVAGGIGANHLLAGYADFNRPTGTALWVKGKENTPTLATVYADSYANFHSANGGYACWSFGGSPGPPYDGWCQVSNTAGTALDMWLQPVGGNVKAPTPTAGDNSTKVATTAFVQTALGGASSVLRGYIDGLILSTAGASTTYGIAAGVATDSTGVGSMSLASAYTKTTAAWAVGSGAGSLDTGAIAANTWYHVWLIKRTDTNVVDALVSLSATAPTMPASYTLKRRIGSMKTNGSSQWIKFIQNGNLFVWDVSVSEFIAVNPGTAAVLRTLTVPTGVKVLANMSILTAGASMSADYPGGVYLTDPSQTDTAASGSIFTVYGYAGFAGQMNVTATAQCMTNTSAQIRTRVEHSTAGTNVTGVTHGWVDQRGGNA